MLEYFLYFNDFGTSLTKLLFWNIWLFELPVFSQSNFHLSHFISQVLLSSILANSGIMQQHSSKNKQVLKCFQEWRPGEHLIQEQSET